MVEIKRGDLVLVDLEPIKGSEQGGVRPAVIIQNDIYNKYSPTTIIAPITSKTYKKEYPTNVFLDKKESKLKIDSNILLNQIKTIDKRRIKKKIHYLSGNTLEKINVAIKVSLGIINYG